MLFIGSAVLPPSLPALADDASIGLSLAPLLGRHEESGLRANIAPVPIPIVQVRGRKGSVELSAEGLPFTLPIDAHSDPQSSSTRLSFFDAVLRAYVPGDRFSAGIGALVYNQTTIYGPPADVVNASRVAGARYEIGVGLLRDVRRLRLLLDLMPNMHGDVYFRPSLLGGREFRTAEAGSQVELQLQGSSQHGPLRLEYGVRYIDYVTKFVKGNSLADRNVGLLPFITFFYRMGRS